jgi:hypothetical protein
MRYLRSLKMGFNLPIVSRLAGTLALCLVAMRAPAQSTLGLPSLSGGSSGSDDPAAAAAAALSGTQEHHLDLSSQLKAPQSLFGPSVDDSMAPPMPMPVNTLQQMVQQKPNWTQMTPDEILGVQTTPKQQDAKTLADQMLETGQTSPNQSALETFLMNRRLAETGSTNVNHLEEGSFLDPVTGLANPQRAAALQNSSVFHSAFFNRLLENAQDSYNNAGNPEAAWSRVFTAPAATTPSPAQTAEMSAFQQLLQPTAPAQVDSGKSEFGFPKPASLPDPNVEPVPVGYNPAGASFAPQESGVGRPKRLPGLPTATTMPSVPSLTPAWGPQPPPWTIKTPQLFVEPVRQF